MAVVCSALKVNAQDNAILNVIEDERVKKITSLKTNYLAELFQAAVDNDILSYSRSNVTFKSTLFGIKKLFDTTAVVDTNYKKAFLLRNIEISSKIGMGAQSKINEVTPGFKWALINKRDLSNVDRSDLREMNDSLTALTLIQFNILGVLSNGNGLTIEEEDKLNEILSQYTNFSTSSARATLSAKEKTEFLIKKIEENNFIGNKFQLPKANLDRMISASKNIDALLKKREEAIKKGAILNLTGYGRYKDVYWDSASVGLEFIKGLGNKKDEDKPWDFQASAFYNTKLATNLNNQTSTSYAIGKLGINKVLIKNKAGASLVEVLGAAEVNHAFEKPAVGDQTKILVDFTLTLRINKTTFLPIEIKYDPKNANVFGYFKLKWDITSDN